LSLTEKHFCFPQFANDLFDGAILSWHFDLSPSLNPNLKVGSAFGGQVNTAMRFGKIETHNLLILA
jgi:hypothetical protein